MVEVNKILREMELAVETGFLEKAEVKLPRERLEARVNAVFNVFTQSFDEKERARKLDFLVESIYVIGAEYWSELPERRGFFDAGINGKPAEFKIGLGYVEVAEPYFDMKGYLEREIVLKLDRNRVSADAVAAFYLQDKFSQHGLLEPRDRRILSVAKLLPLPFIEGRRRVASYRLGNLAREREEQQPDSGLQFIYEETR